MVFDNPAQIIGNWRETHPPAPGNGRGSGDGAVQRLFAGPTPRHVEPRPIRAAKDAAGGGDLYPTVAHSGDGLAQSTQHRVGVSAPVIPSPAAVLVGAYDDVHVRSFGGPCVCFAHVVALVSVLTGCDKTSARLLSAGRENAEIVAAIPSARTTGAHGRGRRRTTCRSSRS